jgi:sporulation protein YlmC with PRC-barrel domain
MPKLMFASSLLAAALLPNALVQAQTRAPAPAAQPATATAGVKLASPHWRSSKMIGLAIYNEQNERIGDVNEILLDGSGKVIGYVVGVGGFLGMGEHDVFIEPNKIKFVSEPTRTASTAPERTGEAPARTDTGTMTTRPASNTTVRAANEIWYPDHGVISGTKDQLKAMPQFKYSSYN